MAEKSGSSTAGASRRAILVGGAAGVLAAGSASARTGGGGVSAAADREILDRAAVADLVQRERSARDQGLWDEMSACWDPKATVEVSWYKGDGAGFVAASKKNVSSNRITLHHMSPSVVRLNGDRALADSDCQLCAFVKVDNIDVLLTSHARLLWRARRSDGRWLIEGLRMIYVRDILAPCSPGRNPTIDETELAKYRLAYRYLSYVLARGEHPAKDDLPGVDRPDLVAALRAGEIEWFNAR